MKKMLLLLVALALVFCACNKLSKKTPPAPCPLPLNKSAYINTEIIQTNSFTLQDNNMFSIIYTPNSTNIAFKAFFNNTLYYTMPAADFYGFGTLDVLNTTNDGYDVFLLWHPTGGASGDPEILTFAYKNNKLIGPDRFPFVYWVDFNDYNNDHEIDIMLFDPLVEFCGHYFCHTYYSFENGHFVNDKYKFINNYLQLAQESKSNFYFKENNRDIEAVTNNWHTTETYIDIYYTTFYYLMSNQTNSAYEFLNSIKKIPGMKESINYHISQRNVDFSESIISRIKSDIKEYEDRIIRNN